MSRTIKEAAFPGEGKVHESEVATPWHDPRNAVSSPAPQVSPGLRFSEPPAAGFATSAARRAGVVSACIPGAFAPPPPPARGRSGEPPVTAQQARPGETANLHHKPPRQQQPRRNPFPAGLVRRAGGALVALALLLPAVAAFAQNTVPPAPTVSLMATTERVRISASVSSNGGSAITKWEWRFKGGAFGNYSPWHTVSNAVGNSMVYSAVAQAHGNTYTYQVRAVNAVGNGTSTEESVVVAGVPYQPPAATFTVTAGNASVTLAATTNDGGASISRWEYRQKAGSANYGSWQRVSGTTLSTTVTGLTNGTTYRYQVRAVNSYGNGPSSSEKSARPAATVPPRPDIGLSGGSSKGFHLFGYSRGNGGSAITHWERTHSWDDGGLNKGSQPWKRWINAGTRTSANVKITINAILVLAVKIRVCNSVGCSAESETKYVQTGTSNIPPAKPENFTVTGGRASVTLSANLPSGDGGGTAAKWQYKYKTTGNYTDWKDIPNSRTEDAERRGRHRPHRRHDLHLQGARPGTPERE